ncbi:MAG: bifunctional ADP-dependent NAD(P)H-hydrate dehydratase/NAD(P)H-hydrate epimerase, partial [Thiovulaceae bacterium]|nr:bifunctional ADP-dependent NAD(P)H-hydrate dehydratase/NAD(P)H-hydrate epimerase [Sulfurimonadaceae bacterium]
SAIALGMGLGSEFSNEELLLLLDNELPLLLDADSFSHPLFLSLLKREQLVLTPHPKEFTTILKACKIADITVKELQNSRFYYVGLFCKHYPSATLLLKGANVIIGQHESFYINPHGTNILAKGGSGDVLAGLVAALMAQGYSMIHSAIQGSLAHTAAAMQFEKNSYSLTPNDLIGAITTL